MSQTNENKAVEGVVESTLSCSNIFEKIVENKNMLCLGLGLGLLGYVAFYKNKNFLVESFNKFYKKDDKSNK